MHDLFQNIYRANGKFFDTLRRLLPRQRPMGSDRVSIQSAIAQLRLEGLTHSREVVNDLERVAQGKIPVREVIANIGRGTGIKVEKLCEQHLSSLAPSLIPKCTLEAAFGPPFLCLETVNETEKAYPATIARSSGKRDSFKA